MKKVILLIVILNSFAFAQDSTRHTPWKNITIGDTIWHSCFIGDSLTERLGVVTNFEWVTRTWGAFPSVLRIRGIDCDSLHYFNNTEAEVTPKWMRDKANKPELDSVWIRIEYRWDEK